MQGVAELQQHVVGHVDHVADRAHPDGPQPRRIHAGDGATRTPEMARAVKRAQRSGASMRARASAPTDSSDSFTTSGGIRSAPPVRAASSRATPATDRQSGRFGVTWIFEDRVVEAQVRDEIGARRGALDHEEAPLVLVPDPQLALRAQHALGFHAANPRRADALPPRQHRAGRGEPSRAPGAALGAPHTTA